MAYLSEKEILKNKVEAINLARDAVNRVSPAVFARFHAGVKFKNDCQLYDKDRKDVNVIFEQHNPFPRVQVRLDVTEYSVRIEAKIPYVVSEDEQGYSSVQYHTESVYIRSGAGSREEKWYDFAPRKKLALDDVLNAARQIDALEEEIRLKQEEISALKSEYVLYERR